ncbi:hypothetical protein [Stenotrophomonas maltophilia]|uniref:hypothetical protein n=1 Tax=Stenotrophomonas maltophilia TaxID=40324 RepID=UPI00201CE1FB|nr:hypothetical protein [Stenotrophomonas maltophilia]UQY97364.1 hypothetical protein LZ605_08380 [Stenotrophomonas maltophilia]
MSNDKKTLADVRPGGRVQVMPSDAARALLAAQYRDDGDKAKAIRINHKSLTDSDKRALRAIEAALSAQPSPGGQDALGMIGANLRSIMRLCRPEDYSISRLDAANIHIEARHALQLLEAALAARQPVGQTFQAGVAEWMGQCFLPSLYSNMTERGDRLLEEVLELLQAHGYDKARVPTLVDYVFSRPVGDPAQEVGGVMVTLAGYCWVAGLDMHVHGHAELARISHPEVMAKIRAKQEAKNALHFDTPLPGNAAAPPAQAVDLADFKALYRAYVRLLESGRDRIKDLGGTCDPVDVMEANDVDLQAARRVLDGKAVGNG